MVSVFLLTFIFLFSPVNEGVAHELNGKESGCTKEWDPYDGKVSDSACYDGYIMPFDCYTDEVWFGDYCPCKVKCEEIWPGSSCPKTNHSYDRDGTISHDPHITQDLCGDGSGPKCGDGRLEGTEECDTGDNMSGDGCSAACKIEPCGNGTLELGEQCDDGNLNQRDGCSSECLLEMVCGNGKVEIYKVANKRVFGEDCDDGNLVEGDGCSPSCMSEQKCGKAGLSRHCAPYQTVFRMIQRVSRTSKSVTTAICLTGMDARISVKRNNH